MAKYRTYIPATSWVQLSVVAPSTGDGAIVRVSTDDCELAFGATEPTASSANLVADQGTLVLNSHASEDAWVYSTGGAYLEVDEGAAPAVFVNPSA